METTTETAVRTETQREISQVYRWTDDPTGELTGRSRCTFGEYSAEAVWTMERSLGRCFVDHDAEGLLKLYEYEQRGGEDGQTLYRYGTRNEPPAGWTTKGVVGGIHASAPAVDPIAPLYELSRRAPDGGPGQWLYTTSEFERRLAIELGYRQESKEPLGYLVPAVVGLMVRKGETPGVAASEPPRMQARLRLGACVEVWLDPNSFEEGSRITEMSFFEKDPHESPDARPRFVYRPEFGRVNTTVRESNLRMWGQTRRSAVIANHESKQLEFDRPSVWFKVTVVDAKDLEWTLDPELINEGGNVDGGPTWASVG